MASRDQVLQLLDHGHSYESAALELGIPAGQAYMVATGRPADSSHEPAPGRRLASGSPQALVNPRSVNPTRNPRVIGWVRERASRELKPGA